MRWPYSLIVISTMLLLPVSFAIADWPQFRGTNAAGIANKSAPPIHFSAGQNELWRVPMESGHSSPCVTGELIFLTTFDSEQKQLAVVCLDKTSGETIWRRPVDVDEIETGHPSFNPASSTPACDGERVVAYFGSFGLVCFDIAGELLWTVKMPLAKSYAGNATSPIIVDDRVILYRGNNVGHFVLAVDKRTGEQIWKKPQPEKFAPNMACTATPIVAGELVIIHGIRSVRALRIEDGEQVWNAQCSTTGTSTPVVFGEEVLVATWNQTGESALIPELPSFQTFVTDNDKNNDGEIEDGEFPKLMRFHRSEGTEAPENGWPIRFKNADEDKDGKISSNEWNSLREDNESRRANMMAHGLVAIRIDSTGELREDDVRTLEAQGIPEVPSPVAHDGYVYFVKNGGIMTCIEITSAKNIYKRRTGGRGTHYASPVVANGHIYSAAGDGTITVMKLGPKPKILANNKLGELTYASPAIVDNVIYVRTQKTFFAFAEQTK